MKGRRDGESTWRLYQILWPTARLGQALCFSRTDAGRLVLITCGVIVLTLLQALLLPSVVRFTHKEAPMAFAGYRREGERP